MRITGATQDTTKRMVIDSAAVYFNYGEPDEYPIGATQEGATFTVEQTIRQVPIDGFRGPIKDARRVTEEMARITCGIMEMTSDNLTRIITGSTVSDHTASGAGSKTHNAVRRQSDLPDEADYLSNVALVGRVQGSAEPIVIVLYNALSDGGLELETTDQEEGTLTVQFTANFDPNDPDTSPWEIRFPADVDEQVAS